jgi:dTDP-4-amino-4,6-dideoxygalactose transaminase
MIYPVSKPSITDLEKKYLKEVIDSEWISSKSPFVERFEKAWASYNKMKYGVACSSGTSALVIALRAIGIKAGDEVIVPEFTMVATAWAVSYIGANPIFVDCGDDLNINPDLIEEKITKKTKAIIPVSVYGRMYSDKVLEIAKKYNLVVIEDLAEAHGTPPRGDIACYSLFANKIISSGEGGICLTDNKKYADLMIWYRSMCFNAEHTFLHPDIGYNFRMTGLQGAVALAQVERLDEILKKRKQIEEWYNTYLPKEIQMPKRDVLWMYDIVVKNKEKVMEGLKECGVETRHFFKAMSQQPMYNRDYLSSNAFNFSKFGLYLPTYTDLTEEDVKFISEKVKDLL